MKDVKFYRTELRVIRSTCKDEEEFLHKVAKMLSDVSARLHIAETRAGIAEHQVGVYRGTYDYPT
jgi:hypothetical protein